MADAAALLLIDSSEGLLPYPASSSKTPATAAATVDETAAGEGEPKEVPKKGKKGGKGKRKTKAEADAEEAEEDAEDGEGGAKKAKTTDTPVNGSTASVPNLDPQQAAMVASFLGVLDADSLKAPTLPTPEEMGKVLLEVRKKALRDEYGV